MNESGRSWSAWPLPFGFETYDEYRNFLNTKRTYVGSSESDILALLTLGPCCVLLAWAFVTWNLGSLHSPQPLLTRLVASLEFIFVFAPSLVALTIGSNVLMPLVVFVLFSLLGFLTVIDQREQVLSASGKKAASFKENAAAFYNLEFDEKDPNKITPILNQSVSEFRSLVMIVTSVCILAVDFPAVFPDKYHKSDIFGTSIMDLGVGGFVVANGLVSKEARSVMPSGWKGLSIRNRFWLGYETLKSTFRTSLLLGFMGVARAIAVHLTGYHVVVTEYGVHWNFFLTLAVVRLVASTIFTVFPHRMAWILGLSNVVMYQICLSVFGWQRVVLHGLRAISWSPDECSVEVEAEEVDPKCDQDTRVGFIDANREGIFSLWGFLSLYLFSIQLGRVFFRPKRKMSDWIGVLVLFSGTGLMCMGSYMVTTHPSWPRALNPSRRLANANYVVWTLANCTYAICLTLAGKILVIFMSFQHRVRGRPVECILLRAINWNPLTYFILANLWTGLTNLVFPTLLMGRTSAMLVLFNYITILAVVIYYLFIKKIRIA